MKHRELGKTGFEASVIGLGCAQLGSSNTEYAINVVRKALEFGVNYYDTARGYWDSEIKLGLALKDDREKAFISSKTGGKTREEAWKDLHESLERLQTDYLDNYHLHGLRDGEDLEKRLGPDGALEALIEARDQGLIRHIGCTSHSSSTLIKALERFDFEVISVPMNIVEREPLTQLIPLCISKGVGVTIMKPVATGLLPARLALKWLLNQPISTALPGTTTIEEVEEDAAVGHLDDPKMTLEEEEQVHHLTKKLENVRCRVCRDCEPCPQDIEIGLTLGTDVIYGHYRTMGPEAFKFFPWSPDRIKNHFEERRKRTSAIESCTECGDCEERCPYDLPIVKILRETVEPMKDILKIWRELAPFDSALAR